ncbi:MAG: peptide-binding protein [Firmicutes bacterium]|nr:peptide-binding protein [Bacillota bacterium]
MKRALSLTVVLALVLVLAVSGLALAANKSPKGQITVGQLGDVETLNPLLSEENAGTMILNGLFSQLIRVDEKGNFVPDLATQVPTVQNGGISKDGLVYTFHLRKGVKFHDGQPLTAEDVKFTWETLMNDKVQVVSRDGFDKIKKFEVVNPYTVRMTLDQPYAPFLVTWAQTAGDIVPKHILGKLKPEEITKGGDFSRHPIGSGPFKFKEWKEATYIIIEANKNYFGKGPYLEKVIFKVVPDTNTLLTQVKTGEVDVVNNIQPKQYVQIKDDPRLNVQLNPASIYLHITFNLKNPIFQDKRVRQALSYALPRDLIVKSILNGIGQPAAGSTSPVLWAYDKSIKPYPYDLKKANELLDEAGWEMGSDGIRVKDGKPLSFEISTNSENQTRLQIEQVAQQEWKKIGVDLKIKNYEATTLFGDVLEQMKFDTIMFAWVTGSDPDEFTLYHSSQIPTPDHQVGQNYINYKNPEMDKLLEEGQKTTDIKKRKEIYSKIQKIYAEDQPMLYVYYYVNIDVAPKALENWRPAPFTNTMTWNINEWKLK